MSIENILIEKINELGQFLINHTDNEEKKKLIKDSLVDLPLYKILLFISFINKERIDNQIEDFLKIYGIVDTKEIREKIKDSLNYFINVKNILNDK
jgi:hypothetical protein